MKFKRYQHIGRIGDAVVEGLLDGEVYVFPKIDGANVSIYWGDGKVQVASRNGCIDDLDCDDPEVDVNFRGFVDYVKNHDGIQRFIRNYPYFRLCGEWLVPHSLKSYRETAWNQLYIFDVKYLNMETNKEGYIHYEVYKSTLDDYGINYIPPICVMENPKLESLYPLLEKNIYLIEDGKGSGEGIVCKNYSFINRHGKTIWGKIVKNEFKETHIKAMGVPEYKTKNDVEQKIVDNVVTETLVDKEISKIAFDCGSFENKHIGRLLDVIWNCLITEELIEQISKLHNPTIDFKRLNSICFRKVKKIIGV